MIKQSNKWMILFSVLFANSCSGTIDRSLSPPPDTQWVKVEVKNPSPYTRPFPLKVVYISHRCLKSRISGVDGSRIEEPSYYGMKIPLEQQGNSNVWNTKVAMLGGGTCQWTLSEFTMGIEYSDATHLGKELVPGTGVGVIMAFDSKASQNGTFSSAYGNVVLSPQYYPLIDNNIQINNDATLNLFGEEEFLKKRIYVKNNEVSISFEPNLDESKIVKMVAPKEHKNGEFYKIIYPDGTVVSDGSIHPDINKLMK